MANMMQMLLMTGGITYDGIVYEGYTTDSTSYYQYGYGPGLTGSSISSSDLGGGKTISEIYTYFSGYPSGTADFTYLGITGFSSDPGINFIKTLNGVAPDAYSIAALGSGLVSWTFTSYSLFNGPLSNPKNISIR